MTDRRHIHIAVTEDVSRRLTTIAHDGHGTISEVVELLVEGSVDHLVAAKLKSKREDAKKGGA